MTFKKVLSFFLTGATALSMTTAALAADDTPIMLPADVASQDWYAPAVRYVMEYDLMDVGTLPEHKIRRRAVAGGHFEDGGLR